MNIGIIGGGCAGTLVTVHLLAKSRDVSVRLIEPRAELGRGLAYSTACAGHLLNVAAGNMSALPARPAQFSDWLAANGCADAAPQVFASRQVYGMYLGSLLQTAIEAKPHAFRRYRTEAVDIDCAAGTEIRLKLADGTALALDRVIFATGNPPPARVTVSGLTPGEGGYFHSTWEAGALDCPRNEAPVLLIGSGLTAVDALVALRARGYGGLVYMVSRHGLIPHAHARCPRGCATPAVQPGLPLRAVVRALRAAAAGEPDWRAAVDGLRPISNLVWSRLTTAERRQFQRHLKAYWDVHRHRMAPQFGDLLAQERQSGGMEVIAGRLRRVHSSGDCLTVEVALRGGGERTITAGRIINCTGPDGDYRRVANPIVQSLFRQRLASPGPLGTGMRTDAHGGLIDAEGRASDRLFTIGPPRTGDLFETIAVPEIRVQAEALAGHVLAGWE